MGTTAADLPDPALQALRLAETYVFGTEPGKIPAVLHEAFEASTDDRVRARLGATLARCWAYAGAHARAVPFADAALAHATATGDDVLVADALDAALATHWGPDELSVRTDLARRLDDVTAHLTDVDVRTQAHLWTLTVALEVLDLPAMNRQMRALELLGEESSRAMFFAASRRLTLDLLRGRTDTAAELVAVAGRALETAHLADGPLVVSSMRAYAAVHSGDRATAAELAQLAEDFAVAEGVRELYAEAAWMWLGAGEVERAISLAATFDAGVLAALPRDFSYLPTLQLVLDVALHAADTDLVARVAPLLAPYAGRAVVASGALMFHGVTDDPLSRAAGLLGDHETATRLRADALAAYTRIGATWWRQRLERWVTGEHAVTEDSQAADSRMTLRPGPPGTWLVGHAGTTTAVPARKGMAHLHALLSRPGSGVDAVVLAGGQVAEGDLGPRADTVALDAYRRRLRELDDALDAADLNGDATAAESLVAERAALLAEVSAATGLGGRARHVGGSAERARVTVRKAIAAAIETIKAADPVVGRHLATHVRTGFTCSYEPDADRSLTWEL
ncbi:hypothetical protein [Nocardioides pocheonensis]|uniref:hypothetical protein n=1 Tax=Nocardioides pocheonensis TaxID=661485 RepID=UPI0011CD6042|nr:hypothetical protein [Nocardioides pocheonensis]